jgi:hypothetical protein
LKRALVAIITVVALIILASTSVAHAYNGPYTYVTGPSDPLIEPLDYPGGDYNCPVVAIGSGITVDGLISDWDTDTPTADLFAPMYRPNAPTYTHQSDLFLRYDPGSTTMYVLVLTTENSEGDLFEGARDEDEAWVKLDGASAETGFTSFEWVELSEAGEPSQAPDGNVWGFEASFALPDPTNPDLRLISVHLNVYGDPEEPMESQTSRTFLIPFIVQVIPEGATIALAVSMSTALGLFVALKRKKL